MNQIISRLIYAGLTKEQYKEIKNLIRADNQRNLISFSLVPAVIFAVMIGISFVSGAFVQYRTTYFVMCGFMWLTYFLSRFLGEKHLGFINFWCYLYMIAYFAYGQINSFHGDPTVNRCALLLVFIFAIPLMFNLKIIKTDIILVINNVIFIALTYAIHGNSVFRSVNIADSIVFTVLGVVIGNYLNRVKIASIYNAYTNRKLMEIDILTGLYNRRSFEETLSRVREKADIYGVAVFDINGLKVVNDTKGHPVGDELICGAAGCIKSVFGEYGECFRIGGDEFAAIFYKPAMDIKAIEEQFEQSLENFKSEDIENLSVSSGIVLTYDNPYLSVDKLFEKADAVMYRNKDAYHGRMNMCRDE